MSTTKKNSQHWGGLLFMAVLMGITGVLIFRDRSLPALLRICKNANPWFLGAGFVMIFLFIACEAKNIQMILKGLQTRLPFRKCLGYSFVGFYFSAITPSASGGQPAQVYYMSRDKIQVARSTMTFMVILLIYQLVIVVYGSLLFLFRYTFFKTHFLGGMGILLSYGIFANLAVSGFLLVAIFSKKWIERVLWAIVGGLERIGLLKDGAAWREKIQRQLEEYAQSAQYMKTHSKLVVQVTLVTVIQITALWMIPCCIYLAFGLHGKNIVDILTAQAMLTLAVASLPLPGAVGASESGFLKIFAGIFPGTFLVPAMLLARGISFYFALAFCGFATMAIHLRTASIPTKPDKKNVPVPEPSGTIRKKYARN